jgi:ribonuclease P protein component
VNFGFSSAVRLKHGWQFDLVFRTGRRETGELVRLLFVERAAEPTKIGVTVGRKIANAAKRSRGRRIMRESFRRLLPWIKDEVWIVASLRENGLEKSSKDVYRDIASSLKRRGLMRQDWPGPDWDADKEGSPCA